MADAFGAEDTEPLPSVPVRDDITGLVLAGGLARRMGGIDKGLQTWQGRSLALHALLRLAPQVGRVEVNANRHLDIYRSWAHPVRTDEMAGHLGPLCGLLTGLVHMQTPWLVTVPCDVPNFPQDLVIRLSEAAAREGADIAIACAPEVGEVTDSTLAEERRHPVFCLIHGRLQDPLREALMSGERRLDRWTASQRRVVVPFPDGQAFANLNTLDDLAQHALQDGGAQPFSG